MRDCVPFPGASKLAGVDLLDAAPEPMVVTLNGVLLKVNRQFCRLFGYSAEACLGQQLEDLISAPGTDIDRETMFQSIAFCGTAVLDTVRRASNGADLDVSILVGPVKLSGSAHGMFYTFREIRQQKEFVARLRHTAMHDALTGLPNRLNYLERLGEARLRLRRSPARKFALMFLDMNAFKAVNDTLGHAAGDALLVEVGRRLVACVRPEDVVARLGGDEFAVLMEDVETVQDVERVIARMHESVAVPVQLHGQAVHVSVSIGFEMVEDHWQTEAVALARADEAMYQAKRMRGQEVQRHGGTLRLAS